MPEKKEEVVEKTEIKDEKKANQDKALPVLLVILLVVVSLGLLTIFVGSVSRGRMAVVRGRAITQPYQNQSGIMDGGRFGGRGGFSRIQSNNLLTGKVTAVNDKQFIVDASGSTKTVQISDSTRFPLDSATSVKVGDTVQVIGQQDSTGVVQAVEIVVNPTN